MSRRAKIIGKTTDIFGVRWDVRERRPTKHGWDVFIGWPQGEPRGRGGRGIATIATPALTQYLIDTRLRDTDLPIGRNTINRLRALIGISWSWDEWWADREHDLLTLTLEQFCALHGCSIGAASQRRAAIKS